MIFDDFLESALKKASGTRCWVILSDFGVPGGDHLAIWLQKTIKKLKSKKESKKGTRVVRVTGWGALRNRQKESNIRPPEHWIEHALACLAARWRIYIQYISKIFTIFYTFNTFNALCHQIIYFGFVFVISPVHNFFRPPYHMEFDEMARMVELRHIFLASRKLNPKPKRCYLQTVPVRYRVSTKA